MRTISSERITAKVKELCLKANIELRPDVLRAIKGCVLNESWPVARKCLQAILDNAAAAKREQLAICQDTGFPAVFIGLGRGVCLGGDLAKAVNKGVNEGYREGSFRPSIVADPLQRGKPGFTPAVCHIESVPGNRISITVLPKGFGCENKTRLKMFNPTASVEEVKKFIVETVKDAGPDACPPYIVGVGIGGNADHAALMAKKALLKKISTRPEKLERELLTAINALRIGPMGMGGKVTALGVSIIKYPTHIAGLPVAVSVSCHALRSASGVL